MWEYNEKVLELYRNPENIGEIKDADAIGEVGSLVCGDSMKLYLKIKDGRIIDAKFQTFGCTSAIASSVALTKLIKGKTIEEAAKITNKDIIEYLGGLPEQKIHCSVMGEEALKSAINNYLIKNNKAPISKDEIICKCRGVTKKKIIETAKEYNTTEINKIMELTGAGQICGGCIDKIKEIVSSLHITKKQEKKDKWKNMTIIEKINKIQEILDNEVKPLLLSSGGDIELIDIKDNVIYVKLKGICDKCVHKEDTLKNIVEKHLKEALSSSIEVHEAT